MRTDFENGWFARGDCFDWMRTLPDQSVDMVLCDLPYGTTQNKWDSVLPLDALWSEYWRVCRGAVVLTAAQPFTSVLVMSAVDRFKYDWVWRKSAATGHLNAKKQPMRQHESVLIFGNSNYRPQGLMNYGKITRRGGNGDNFGVSGTENMQQFTNYPRSVLDIASEGKTIHPTQKPVALFEYLIRTYTDAGMTVLDNTAGSGTTAIAAENAGRKWICIERDEVYYDKAIHRVREHLKQQSLFGEPT